jgi:hypothetical protein
LSWIFGLSGSITDDLKNEVASFLPQMYQSSHSKNLLLYWGGISETTHSFAQPNNSTGWIICGLGIMSRSKQTTFLSKYDWQKLLLPELPNIRKVNGHFVGVKWDRDSLLLFNDFLGLREIYLIKMSDCLAFSTRIGWLTRLHRHCQIDFKQFGAAWLNINQWSDRSFISPIKRLGPGAIVKIRNSRFEFKKNPWVFEQTQIASANDLIGQLKKYTLFSLNQDMELTLGLSGGLDSRVLLALLLSQQNKNWSLHTFGDLQHPDAQIAKNIAQHFKIKHTTLDTPLPPVNICLNQLHDNLEQNIVFSPASEIMRLRWYLPLYDQNKIVIDGGFGEILRRQFLNRLLLKGRKAIINKDASQIALYLTHHRGNFFTHETVQEMQSGIVKQINYLIETLPDVADAGLENWMDLLAVRSRLPNLYGFTQACVDSLVINYMPYAQLDVLKYLFNIPAEQRKNGKLLRSLIHQQQPDLAQFPLVKGLVTYPYKLSTLGAMFWTAAKQKLGMYYQNTESKKLLDHLSDFVQDTVHSQNVKSFPHYNYPYLINLIEKHYSGETQNDVEIDWWVAFEIWRGCIYNS